jgi:hypothetical protein
MYARVRPMHSDLGYRRTVCWDYHTAGDATVTRQRDRDDLLFLAPTDAAKTKNLEWRMQQSW